MFQFIASLSRRIGRGSCIGVILSVGCVSAILCQTAYGGDEVVVPRNFMGQPVPKWENGFFVGFEFTPERSPSVYAYDRNGNKVFETWLELDGAYKVVLRSMAASRDGRFAFSGVAENGSATRVFFIAFLDSAGRIVRVNRLDRIAARHLCFSADGTLWAAVQPVLQYPDLTAPEHDVLRAYSPSGDLKFSLLPRSSFAATPDDPLQSHPVADGQSAASQLAANGSEVAFMSSGFKELVRVSLAGKLLSRVRMERPAKSYLTGFALAPTGGVYASTQEDDPGDAKKLDFAFYRWNPANSNWDKLFRRSSRDRGLPLAIAMLEEDGRMLVKTEDGRFRWLASSAGGYQFGSQP